LRALDLLSAYAESVRSILEYHDPNDGVSMTDKTMTGSFQINLPKDLLSEAKRIPKVKKDQFKVEGWRNSWLTRISEMFVGKE
jgi:hypothetical protein